ncbi:MAG: hypothetical protein J4G17_03160 [Anaerolineae bacterium]|nr:hypothetical protein [Anaerolineae bacterium]
MKITEVRSTIVRIPRRRALLTYYGESPDTATVVAEVVSDEGITGIGQTIAPAPFYGDSVEVIQAGIETYLAPAMLGRNPFAIEQLFADMVKLSVGNYAITAIEMALWDLKGRALGVPVYELLGGRCNAGAPLHAFADRDDPELMAESIQQRVDEGWTWFKTKIGFDVQEDVNWYAQLREMADERARFQLDGNTGYTLGQAVESLSQMERIGGVALFEQPVRFLDEMAALAKRLNTPLQADELTLGPRSIYEIARNDAAHVLHYKLEKYGGILPGQKMNAIAEAAGLEISVAPYFDIMAAAAAHLAASTRIARWPAGFSDMTDTLLAEPYEPQSQVLEPLDRPGLGVEIDQDKLAYCAAHDGNLG